MKEALAFLSPEQVARLVADYTLMVTNLSHVQERCTELLTENRELRAQLDKAQSGILLPGWVCRACGIFNGEQKEKLDTCRVCEAHNPRSGGWTCKCGSWNMAERAACRHCEKPVPHEYVQVQGGGIGQCAVCGSDDERDGGHVVAGAAAE